MIGQLASLKQSCGGIALARILHAGEGGDPIALAIGEGEGMKAMSPQLITQKFATIRILILIMLLSAAPFAHAQDVVPQDVTIPPTQTIDPRSVAVAQDIVKSFDMKNMLQGILGAMSKAIVPLIAQANPGQDSKIQSIVFDAVQKSMAAHMDEMDKNKAVVYAEMFSYDELVQLRDFYQSPVGQKMIKSTPQMMTRSMALDQNIMLATMREANRQILQQLKDNGMKVPKELGV